MFWPFLPIFGPSRVYSPFFRSQKPCELDSEVVGGRLVVFLALLTRFWAPSRPHQVEAVEGSQRPKTVFWPVSSIFEPSRGYSPLFWSEKPCEFDSEVVRGDFLCFWPFLPVFRPPAVPTGLRPWRALRGPKSCFGPFRRFLSPHGVIHHFFGRRSRANSILRSRGAIFDVFCPFYPFLPVFGPRAAPIRWRAWSALRGRKSCFGPFRRFLRPLGVIYNFFRRTRPNSIRSLGQLVAFLATFTPSTHRVAKSQKIWSVSSILEPS